jgi:predicted RNase H-like nuclease (RuvC/YqgF family)
MTEEEAKRLQCENAYLKDRCAQLQASVADLDARLARANHRQEPSEGKRGRWHLNLMSGGQ